MSDEKTVKLKPETHARLRVISAFERKDLQALVEEMIGPDARRRYARIVKEKVKCAST